MKVKPELIVSTSNILSKILHQFRPLFGVSSFKIFTFCNRSFISSENDANQRVEMELLASISSALDQALERNSSAIIFGEDIAFGEESRCTKGLRNKYKQG